MRRFGASEAAIQEARRETRSRGAASVEAAEIWPEHQAALEAFLAVDSQWRVAAAGIAGISLIGLDYAAVVAVFGLLAIVLTTAQWQDFREIEAAACQLLNDRAGIA
jgi:Phage related hypothetical protein (DUF1799)